MKLFFDARFVRFPRHDGISRFSSNLVTALAKQTEVTMIIYDKRQLQMLPDLPYVKLNQPTSPRELFIARKLNRLGAEVVFCPMQIMGSWGRRYHLILTIHDLIYYFYKTPPRNINPLLRFMWRLYHLSFAPQRRLLDRADFIVAVSKTTKKLMQHYRLTKRPIRVVYNAPSSIRQAVPKKPTKNLVYMGTFMPYKNVETLAKAMFFLPGYQLHCLSKISAGDRQRLTELAPSQHIVFHDGVSEEKYAELLTSAHALVTASKNEGFGLPIIEALQAGVPVVCSDLPIFHEVAGNAALFFDPDAPAEFAKKIVKLETPTVRATMIKQGQHQAEQFNWDNSARALLDAIKALVD